MSEPKVNIITDKKLDDYRYKLDNLVAENEITITITLNEYRDLIQSDATSRYRIDQANNDKYARDSENDKLKARVKELEAEVFELKTKLSKFVTVASNPAEQEV